MRFEVHWQSHRDVRRPSRASAGGQHKDVLHPSNVAEFHSTLSQLPRLPRMFFRTATMWYDVSAHCCAGIWVAGQCDGGAQRKQLAGADAAGELSILLDSLDALLATQQEEPQPVAAGSAAETGSNVQCQAGAAELPVVNTIATPAEASPVAVSMAEALGWGFEALQCSLASGDLLPLPSTEPVLIYLVPRMPPRRETLRHPATHFFSAGLWC